MIRVSRSVIKLIKKMDGDLDSYRYYVIGRHHYARRSGIFSLNELCDLLHSDYNYSSLHRGPGNDRSRFKRRLYNMFSCSILFTELPDGRFKINSEKRLISIYSHGARNGWYNLPDNDILSSKRLFLDFCIGMLLSGNKFRANKNIADYSGFTVRRIQLATSRNHKSRFFIKRYNFIEDFSGSYKDVEKYRAILFNVHDISSPLPFRYGKEWVLRLNAPNSYSASVLSGVKGDKAYQAGLAQPTISANRSKECWFVPVCVKKPKRPEYSQLTFFRELEDDHSNEVRKKRWFFNTRVYDFESYIADHSGLSL